MLQRFETNVQVSGRGATKDQAVADALSSVQRAVMASGKLALLRIEPLQVAVVKAEEMRTEERFLFFFLPRVHTAYSVTLDVTATVTALDTSQILFVASLP